MKPLTKRPHTSSADATAAVVRLLAALDRAGEGVAIAALDDQTLADVAAAVSHAADLCGRWLAGRPGELGRRADREVVPTPAQLGPADPVVPTPAVQQPPADAARVAQADDAGPSPAGPWVLFG